MYFSAILMVFASLFVFGSSAADCDGFTPCSCYDLPDGLYVMCDAPIAMIKHVFSKSKVKSILSLAIAVNVLDSIIPANFTGSVQVSRVGISGPIDYARQKSPKPVLSVDLSAFSQSKLTIESFGIQYCDLSKMNWGFLNGFTKLSDFGVANCDNFAATFNTLPSASLTSLSRLSIGKLSDIVMFLFPNFKYPALLKNGLTQLTISGVVYPSTMSDAIIQNFLANWITPSSRKTLTELWLTGNSITKVPSEISKYNNLIDVVIWSTQPWVVQSNAFNMTKNTTIDVRSLSMTSSQITSIQPGAFQGFYGNWKIYLYINLLTQLSSSVFQPLLQQMTVTNGFGFINFDSNPFDCFTNLCGLSWLIRDNRPFLEKISAQCSNGTDFNQLDPLALRFPNGTKCP